MEVDFHLFLAMPVACKSTLAQYAGPLHRLHPAKTSVRIDDYADRDVPALLRMFEKRLRAYPAIGYGRESLPPSKSRAETASSFGATHGFLIPAPPEATRRGRMAARDNPDRTQAGSARLNGRLQAPSDTLHLSITHPACGSNGCAAREVLAATWRWNGKAKRRQQ